MKVKMDLPPARQTVRCSNVLKKQLSAITPSTHEVGGCSAYLEWFPSCFFITLSRFDNKREKVVPSPLITRLRHAGRSDLFENGRTGDQTFRNFNYFSGGGRGFFFRTCRRILPFVSDILSSRLLDSTLRMGHVDGCCETTNFEE